MDGNVRVKSCFSQKPLLRRWKIKNYRCWYGINNGNGYGCGGWTWTNDLRVSLARLCLACPSKTQSPCSLGAFRSSPCFLTSASRLYPPPAAAYRFAPTSVARRVITLEEKKSRSIDLLLCGCGGWTWTNDLRVMSPTSYQLLHSAVFYLRPLSKCFTIILLLLCFVKGF